MIERRVAAAFFLAALALGHGSRVAPVFLAGLHQCVCNQKICVCSFRDKSHHRRPATPVSAVACHRATVPEFSLEGCESKNEQFLPGMVYLLPVPISGPAPARTSENIFMSQARPNILPSEVLIPPPRS